ncbi:WYL domain-containing protein [Mesorhizobium sp. M1066]|uniref:WYL domain-containing protein n=1 Tax=unclassified Mesorhizobium TaxID=325217 RepID=UPI00333BB6AD
MGKAIVDKPGARWGAERRIEFIDFKLRWEGTVNRAQLVEFFGISVQQASVDLAAYAERWPANLVYDRSAKTYRAAPNFVSGHARLGAEYYLDQLVAKKAGGDTVPSFIGWEPPSEVLSYPSRPVKTDVLREVLAAIRQGREVQVTYQSMRRPDSSIRWIAPHALANDGARWHARAWCFEGAEFRDFVLARIDSVRASRPLTIDSLLDQEWHTSIDIVLRPRAGLSKSQRGTVEAEYGMKSGRLLLKSRRALAYYVLRQLHLEPPAEANVAEQPIEAAITEDLAGLIEAGRKRPYSAHRNHQGEL